MRVSSNRTGSESLWNVICFCPRREESGDDVLSQPTRQPIPVIRGASCSSFFEVMDIQCSQKDSLCAATATFESLHKLDLLCVSCRSALLASGLLPANHCMEDDLDHFNQTAPLT